MVCSPAVTSKRTLDSEAALKAWLGEVEALLTEKLKSGPVAL